MTSQNNKDGKINLCCIYLLRRKDMSLPIITIRHIALLTNWGIAQKRERERESAFGANQSISAIHACWLFCMHPGTLNTIALSSLSWKLLNRELNNYVLYGIRMRRGVCVWHSFCLILAVKNLSRCCEWTLSIHFYQKQGREHKNIRKVPLNYTESPYIVPI